MLRAVIHRTSPSVWLSVLGLSAGMHAAALVSPGGGSASSLATASQSIDVQMDISLNLDALASESDTTTIERVTLDRPKAGAPILKSSPERPTAKAPVGADETPAQAASAETAVDDTPRFTVVIGGAPAASESVSPAGHGATDSAGDEPLTEQSVDSRARLVRGVAPAYPARARADRIEADVLLDLVVSSSGAVTDARVLHPCGHGLDEAAVAAARQFRFAPASKAGRSVPVRMRWTMEFRLW